MTRIKRSISSPHDFRSIYQRGRRVSSPNFFLYLRSFSGKNARFAIVVPNHVIQKAVKRNLVRRRLRCVLRSRETAQSGIEGIISVRTDISRAPFSLIKEELEKMFTIAAGRTL